MRSDLLRVFRTADGRSFGRAFAILYLLAAVVAAFGSGASAAMASPGALCIASADDKAPLPAPASGTHIEDCCLTGHGPTAAATPSTPVELPGRIALAATTPVATTFDLPGYLRITAASPRGPPLDA
jgi:hypothetical protein